MKVNIIPPIYFHYLERNIIKILFIGAHPDDVELGCGGTIHKLCEDGHDVRVIHLGEGTSCRYSKEELSSKEVENEIKNRTSYAIKSLNNLGVNSYKFYDLPCGRLDCVPLIDINKTIEKEINEFRPNAVYTHSNNDTNNDHRIIHKSTIIATRPGSKTFVEDVYLYEVLSSTEWNFIDVFRPNRYINLSASNVTAKIDSINMYETEVSPFPYPRSSEGIMTLARLRGMQIGVKYSEAFRLFRSLR